MKIFFILVVFEILLFSKGYYPKENEINYPNKVSAGSNYCSILKSSPPNTTIVLKPGSYGGCEFSNKDHITLIAEKPGTVTITGTGNGAFDVTNSHHINIIGLNVTGTGIMFIGGYTETSHHIYLGGITANNLSWHGIFTGPNSHDITLDKSSLTNFTGGGYGWYMLGYHLTVTNNYFKNIKNFSVLIRGYHPLNKQTGWTSDARDPIRNNPSKYQELPSNEWSTYIANNEFADKHKDIKGGDSNRGAHIGYYSAWNNPSDPDDDQYFPSQNNIIENNVFYNAAIKDKSGSISLTEGYGFPQGASGTTTTHNGKTVIRGSSVLGNYSDQPLFREYDNPNKSLLKISGNKEGMSISELKALGEKIRKTSPPDSPVIPYAEIANDSLNKNWKKLVNNFPPNIISPYDKISRGNNPNGDTHIAVTGSLTAGGDAVTGKFPLANFKTLNDQRTISLNNIYYNREIALYYTNKVLYEAQKPRKTSAMEKENNLASKEIMLKMFEIQSRIDELEQILIKDTIKRTNLDY